MADMLGVERSSYTRYEIDSTQPSLQSVTILARFFNVSADFLILLTDDPIPTDEREHSSTHGWTQLQDLLNDDDSHREQLAKYVGVPVKTIRKWESEEQDPTRTQMSAILSFFDVSADYMFAQVDDPQNHKAPGGDEQAAGMDLA